MFFMCFGIYAQNTAEKMPRTYVAHYTNETMQIDGKGLEDSWEKAIPTDLFIDIEGTKKPKYNTTVKMLWDKEFVYFLAKMDEPHIWGNLKRRDTVIFYNNDFEIFIDPDNDTHNYYEFEINALNTLWDLFITKPYRENTPVLNDWDANGIKSAIHIKGTLNDPRDTDDCWFVEVAIPFKVFRKSYGENNVPENKFWRVNFSRVNWDFQLENNTYSRKKDSKGKFLPEYNWVWSPTGVINIHQPEDWGYVYFSSNEVGSKESFTIPKDEKVKRLLYQLYRKQKQYFKKNRRWASTSNELSKEPLKIEDQTVILTLENHQTGWNIAIQSPFTKQLFIIKEDGKIIQKAK